MKTYKLELEYTSNRDEYLTEKGTISATGKTVEQAKASAKIELRRFKNPVILYEYEVK